MKKFIAFFLLVFLFYITFNSGNNPVFGACGAGNAGSAYTFYYKQGNTGRIEICEARKAEETKARLKNIKGESLSYQTDESEFERLISKYNIKVTFTEEAGKIKSAYGFSNKFNNFLYIDGKKINVQISYDNGYITIGTPVIFGGF